MSKTNGQADTSLEEPQKQSSVENELPVADPSDGFEERSATTETPGSGAKVDDLQTLRAERDNLFDRLARLQAEFDNYRKRAAKEKDEFRDYAVSDAARTLLPVMDSFNLALKNSAAKPEDLRKGVELIYKQ